MYKNNKDSNNSSVIGQRGEDLFEETIRKRKHIKVEKANWNQQVKEHWDYKLIGNSLDVTVEVKAMKRVGRWKGKPQEHIIWIEFKNVGGNAGWLYGKSDLIAFQCVDGFLIVSRERLSKLCEKLVNVKYEDIHYKMAGNSKGLYVLYNRKGRYDVITQITKDDVLSIKHEYLKF